MTRETLNTFEGQNNVTKITSDDGSVSYLTPSTSFAEEAFAKGACKLNTVETEKKHVLFLFNSADVEVGRYYLGKKLQGLTPSEIAQKKSNLCVFKSYNSNDEAWVPCVGLSMQENLAVKAVSF